MRANIGPLEKTVIQKIKDLKTKSGDSTRKIAESTGISKSSLSRKINGKNSWTLGEIDALAEHWGYESGFELILDAKNDTE